MALAVHYPPEESNPIDALYAELTQLQHRYGETLEQESLTDQVKQLKDAIARYREGSAEAAGFLQTQGHALMEAIRSKLAAATAEQARLLDESPAAASDASGRHVHHSSRAAALAADAEARLDEALEEDAE